MMGRWRYLSCLLVAVAVLATSGCDRKPADHSEYAELFEEYYRSQRLDVRSSCIVRGAEGFGVCPKCLVVCFESRSDAPPSGRYVRGDILSGLPDVAIDDSRIEVAERWVVDLRHGRVDVAHKAGGVQGMRIDPLLDALVDLRDRREKEAEILGESLDTRLSASIEPTLSSRLLFEVVFTAHQAGLEFSFLDLVQPGVQLDLACEQGDTDKHLYETDWLGRPVDLESSDSVTIESLGMNTERRWLCRLASQVEEESDFEQTSVEFVTVDGLLEIGMPQATEDPVLFVALTHEGFELSEYGESPSGPLGPRSRSAFPPIDSCPDDGPTICSVDGRSDGADLIAAIDDALRNERARRAASGLEELLTLYDFAALREKAGQWLDENPEGYALVMPVEDIPVGIVQNTVRALSYEDGSDTGREVLFPTVALGIQQSTR